MEDQVSFSWENLSLWVPTEKVAKLDVTVRGEQQVYVEERDEKAGLAKATFKVGTRGSVMK